MWSKILIFLVSLSARRAWIEILVMLPETLNFTVALRKESVDRNDAVQIVIIKMHASLSARRAWIEIIGLTYDGLIASGRSPQGERG